MVEIYAILLHFVRISDNGGLRFRAFWGSFGFSFTFLFFFLGLDFELCCVKKVWSWRGRRTRWGRFLLVIWSMIPVSRSLSDCSPSMEGLTALTWNLVKILVLVFWYMQTLCIRLVAHWNVVTLNLLSEALHIFSGALCWLAYCLLFIFSSLSVIMKYIFLLLHFFIFYKVLV